MNPTIKQFIIQSKNYYHNMYNKLPSILKKYEPTPLGRWNSIHIKDKKKLDIAVSANYDHCGPCGNNYQADKIIKKKINFFFLHSAT